MGEQEGTEESGAQMLRGEAQLHFNKFRWHFWVRPGLGELPYNWHKPRSCAQVTHKGG